MVNWERLGETKIVFHPKLVKKCRYFILLCWLADCPRFKSIIEMGKTGISRAGIGRVIGGISQNEFQRELVNPISDSK